MNKYLMKRLEEAHLSPKIENLVFITAEAMRGESTSDAFDEFMSDDTESIRKTLGWKDTDEVRNLIDSEVEEKSLAWTMTKYERDGFLAEVHFDEPRNFHFDETGKVRGWTSGGVCYVHWIYADSIGELVENILEKDEQEFQEAVKKAKEEKKSS